MTKRAIGEQQALIADMEALFLSKTQREWMNLLSTVDCCWSIIRPLYDALTEEGAPVTRAADGKRHIDNPIRFREEPAQTHFNLPGYGQHTKDVS